ncbi:hypothetical protein NG800_011575 [Epilithonimonas ginsengisoli]|uniref:Uncharacterized protein n=1 Tax=Epilithonimonas ginsengisoli TaxID=1245592 RepID=A0ABU4JIN8_9FLAO|nr:MULTISPECIES: hypothetical protein [Chryseobacterium group]MBV6879119.1 hypothetical protein [Epilithonimonas sp. FP105]MDW8549553.1 hypothetical protein [Epilithonimonas ginsengisoli]
MKVKVVYSSSASGVENKINDFLKSQKLEIIDIKWSMSESKYSAMIMYK